MSKAKGVREVPATEFFLDYRKTAVQAGEVLRKVRFKYVPLLIAFSGVAQS